MEELSMSMFASKEDLEAARKLQQKKLTFEQWFKEYNIKYGLPPAQVVAEAAWKAAQENK